MMEGRKEGREAGRKGGQEGGRALTRSGTVVWTFYYFRGDTQSCILYGLFFHI